MIRSVVQGCGAYLPERIVTNDELARKMETSDEWIRQRTGITQRHIAADGEFTSHLALKASERALAHAGVKVSDLDLIVLATATPNETFPATATVVQKELGMTKGAAYLRQQQGADGLWEKHPGITAMAATARLSWPSLPPQPRPASIPIAI